MDTQHNFSELLDTIATRFPDQEIWQDIKSIYTSEVDTSQNDKRYQEQNCICCRYRQATGDVPLCTECQKLYLPEPARIIEEYCDCGHVPQGEIVYIYRHMGADTTFCGETCVQKHYQKLFGFFMRRSS